MTAPRPRVPEHVWLPASGPYVSAHIRYNWTGVLPYADKRPGYPDFPAACIPAWLWTPYAALVCAVPYKAASNWTRYFRACVAARWLLCQPVVWRVGNVTLIEQQQLELWEAA